VKFTLDFGPVLGGKVTAKPVAAFLDPSSETHWQTCWSGQTGDGQSINYHLQTLLLPPPAQREQAHSHALHQGNGRRILAQFCGCCWLALLAALLLLVANRHLPSCCIFPAPGLSYRCCRGRSPATLMILLSTVWECWRWGRPRRRKLTCPQKHIDFNSPAALLPYNPCSAPQLGAAHPHPVVGDSVRAVELNQYKNWILTRFAGCVKPAVMLSAPRCNTFDFPNIFPCYVYTFFTGCGAQRPLVPSGMSSWSWMSCAH